MREDCKEIRKKILTSAYLSGHGHIPSCFSIMEILVAVYETMNEGDKFILSKGHAALAHYCVLGLKPDDMGHFNSPFGCHADRLKFPCVNASTGSLGHGIGIAVGMALGFKIQKKLNRVICLIGDGEANEGSVWEAVMVAVNLKLDNLTIIYDNNKSQGRGLQINYPNGVFASFGSYTSSCLYGHDVEELKEALEKYPDGHNANGKPNTVVVDTVKGYGCKTLMNNPAWHRRSPNQAEYEILLKELDENTI